MSSQVLSAQALGAQTFVTLVRAHAATTRKLSTELSADHGLTLNDFEVLLRLSHAPDRRLRRVDLAEQILLTASGITRLLDGLERCGFVERASCASDRRVVYAVLTDAGLEKLREAASSHFGQVEALFEGSFEEHELEALTGLLSRLGGTEPADCGPPE